MLSDPLTPTYNSVGLTLPRASGMFPQSGTVIGRSAYVQSAAEFSIYIERSVLGPWAHRSTILFERRRPDADTNPFNGGQYYVPNRFGLVYDIDDNRRDTAVDIPRLRTSLLALVDSTFESRLIAGEL